MCRILHRFLALHVRLAVRSWRSKDLESIVLRHQLGVFTGTTTDQSSPTRTGPYWMPSRRRSASGTQRPLPPSASLSCPAPPLTPANAVAGPHAVARLHQVRFAISESVLTAEIPTLKDRCNFNDFRLTHRPPLAPPARWSRVVVTGHSSRRSTPPRWTPTGNGLQRGQLCWPPAGSYMAATGQDLMAADTRSRRARPRRLSDVLAASGF